MMDLHSPPAVKLDMLWLTWRVTWTQLALVSCMINSWPGREQGQAASHGVRVSSTVKLHKAPCSLCSPFPTFTDCSLPQHVSAAKLARTPSMVPSKVP